MNDNMIKENIDLCKIWMVDVNVSSSEETLALLLDL